MAFLACMQRLQNVLIVATITVLPFIYRFEIIDPVLLPRFLILSAVLLLILIVMGVNGVRRLVELSILRRAIVPVVISYVVVSALALTQAISLSEGIFDLCRTAVGALTLIVFVIAIHRNGRLVLMISKGLAIASIGLAIIAIAQYFRLAFLSIPGNHIPYATMANKNLLASALLLMLPFLFYLWYAGGAVWRRGMPAAVGLSIYVILLTQTRAVWAALLIAGAVTGMLLMTAGGKAWFQEEKSNWRSLLMPLAGVILLALLAWTATIGFRAASSSEVGYDSLINLSAASMNQRLALWEKSGQMFADNPVLGVGTGNWKVVVPRYGTAGLPSQSGEMFFLRPHNDYLWVLTEAGPVALLLYLSLFLIGLYYGFKVIRSAASSRDRLLALTMIFGLTAFMVVSFFSFPRERIVHLVLVMTILAVLTTLYHGSHPIRQKLPRVVLPLGFVVSTIALTACLFAGTYRYQAETHIQKAVAASKIGSWPAVISEAEQAKSFLVALDPATNPLDWYIGLAFLSMNNCDDAMRYFLEAYQANPYHIQLLNGLATCFEAKGNHLSAIEFYGRAAEISPRDETFLNLAAACYNAGQYQNARDYLNRVFGTSENSEQYRLVNKALMELED